MQEVKYISLLFSTLNLSTIETVRDSVAGVAGVNDSVAGVRQCSRREQCVESIPSIKNKNYIHVYLGNTAHPITTAQVSTGPGQ